VDVVIDVNNDVVSVTPDPYQTSKGGSNRVLTIENALHWQLDVSFREDAARNRKDNGPANIAILRRRALDLARRDTSKGSLSINPPYSSKAERIGCVRLKAL